MLSIDQISKFFSDPLKNRGESILREYLQFKILQIVFSSKYARNLVFLGGTALRIAYNNNRFSEDLDFDYFDLDFEKFQELADIVKKNLELEGYIVEIKNVEKIAFHCYIKIPKLLKQEGLSPLEDQKILIQLDAASHGFEYEPDRRLIDKFGIFTEVFVTPIDILLSQKIYAIFNRKRAKGRDYFDTVFLLSLTKPNYDYLKLKLDINNAEMLKEKLLEKCRDLNFEYLANDVSKFIIKPEEKQRVLKFKEYIEQIEF